MGYRWVLWSLVGILAGPDVAGAVVHHVSLVDPTCAGSAPCHASIQAAVTAARPGDTVRIGAGTYPEQVVIRHKNPSASAGEADRIVIEADPVALRGSVVLRGPGGKCRDGHAVRVQRSRFITLRGLTITGAGGAAVVLAGGGDENHAIHLERLRITGNGGARCHGGITIARGNRDILILNNLVHGNGRNGVTAVDGAGGPHHVIGNTIHGNAWNGVSVGRRHQALLANNVITDNGAATAGTGGRFGVHREGPPGADPAGLRLVHNLVCGNRLGEIDGPVLDHADAGNLTPTGSEGSGVAASPGCQDAATLYQDLAGPDGATNTADDDFSLASGSPAVDAGLDPRILGLPALLHARLEADHAREGARPRGPRFDLGALELDPASGDAEPPAVAFLHPAAGAVVHGAVAVRARAIDDTAVASLGLTLDGHPLGATPIPAPPALDAAATLDTSAMADGTHTLGATAQDAAGNAASTTRVIVTDNTPPDTVVTSAPSGSGADGRVVLEFSGSDNLTAPDALVFAWRVDGEPYTEFSPARTADLAGLAPGVHAFEVKARDRAGNDDPTPAIRSFTIESLQVRITDPAPGATVAEGWRLVRGTTTAGSGGDLGVVVNDVPAAVHGGGFTALVPVAPPAATLTARATTLSGRTASHSVPVDVTPGPAGALRLLARPAAGVAPLTVSFSLVGAPTVETIEVDADGDGVLDFTGATLDGWTFVYAAAGAYPARVRLVDPAGVLEAHALVIVHDRASLDALLRARWQGLREALRQGDVEAAVSFVALSKRPAYRRMFTALGGPLVNVDALLPDIGLVDVVGVRAEYGMPRVDAGVRISHFVLFVLDADGVWRVKFL
jgi:hypothetical protein